MTRTSLVVLLSLATALTVPAGSQAESKKDGRSDGGILGYGEYGRPATLDPITSNEMISVRITELVFNGLVAIDEKQEIVPDLAERWEASKDGRTYAFFLRKDVTWHPKEGEEARPFTADDVVFTYNIMMHPKTITPLKVRYEFIEKVEKLGDDAVQFTLKRPILNALAKFSFKVIPKHGPSNPLYLTREDPFVQHPIGTGPYILRNITADREVILVANEKYFRGRPDIPTADRVRVLRLIENMTMGRNAVGYLTESLHGAGSPQAQRIVIERTTDLEAKKRLAARLAGIDDT